MDTDDYTWMARALEEAKSAAARGEVPIGAAIVDPRDDTLVAANGNRTRELNDPSAHAEILVIREACEKAGAQRIPELDLYVTLEPCAMCAGAISFARIRRLVYGAPDQKGGGVDHGGKFYTLPTCHHRPEVSSGLHAAESAALLRAFFAEKRKTV